MGKGLAKTERLWK